MRGPSRIRGPVLANADMVVLLLGTLVLQGGALLCGTSKIWASGYMVHMIFQPKFPPLCDLVRHSRLEASAANVNDLPHPQPPIKTISGGGEVPLYM